MLRRLPPLNALKAFEAAARHESFTRAAEELCVTQGAVSHQVKALEAELGIKLFNRERQRLVITEAGREYLAVAARRARSHCARYRAPAAAPERRRPDGQHVAGFRGQVACPPPGPICRGPSRDRPAGFGDAAPRRFRARGCRSRRAPRRRQLAGPRCRSPLLRGAVRGLQPQAAGRAQRLKKPADVLKLPLLHLDDRKDWVRVAGGCRS